MFNRKSLSYAFAFAILSAIAVIPFSVFCIIISWKHDDKLMMFLAVFGIIGGIYLVADPFFRWNELTEE